MFTIAAYFVFLHGFDGYNIEKDNRYLTGCYYSDNSIEINISENNISFSGEIHPIDNRFSSSNIYKYKIFKDNHGSFISIGSSIKFIKSYNGLYLPQINNGGNKGIRITNKYKYTSFAIFADDGTLIKFSRTKCS